jgi:hypothetical protein
VAPTEVRRTDARPLALDNSIYVQNVDIYVDTTPGQGFTWALPGRNVDFAPQSAWDVAVVLTPLPFEVRGLVQETMQDAAPHVFVPTNLLARGNTVVARVKLADLGGPPSPAWGYQVLVTGAIWDRTFSATDRLLGSFQENAFTLPVATVAEARAIGGGSFSPMQPRVMDLLAAGGKTQAEILSSGDVKAHRFPVVPLWYAPGHATPVAETIASRAETPEPAAKPAAPVLLRVASIGPDGRIVIPAPEGTLQAWSFAEVLDAEGKPTAKLVIQDVFPAFAVATITEGSDRVQVGAAVRVVGPVNKGAPSP